MERFSAESEPLISERLMLPSCTLRPSAAEAFSSMVGRNWLTGIRNGAMRTRTIKTPTTIRMMRSLPFMNGLQNGANEQSPDGEQGDGPIIICIGKGRCGVRFGTAGWVTGDRSEER